MTTTMERTADRFLATAMLCGLLGMLIGLGMGIGMALHGDHRLAPAHAHLNLIGWAGLLLAGLYYREIDERFLRLARWHFALSLAGLALMIPGLAALRLGFSAGEFGAVTGSLLVYSGFGLFAWVVWRESRGRQS